MAVSWSLIALRRIPTAVGCQFTGRGVEEALLNETVNECLKKKSEGEKN